MFGGVTLAGAAVNLSYVDVGAGGSASGLVPDGHGNVYAVGGFAGFSGASISDKIGRPQSCGRQFHVWRREEGPEAEIRGCSQAGTCEKTTQTRAKTFEENIASNNGAVPRWPSKARRGSKSQRMCSPGPDEFLRQEYLMLQALLKKLISN